MFVVICYSDSGKLIYLMTDFSLNLILQSQKIARTTNMLPLNPFPAVGKLLSLCLPKDPG